MILTFKDAKEALAKYTGKAGKCSSDSEVSLFVREVIQQLLFRGANGNLRKWEFCTQNGTFTAPPDLELPIKMRVEGEVGTVFDKWYEFYDHNTLNNCVPCEGGLVEEINTFFTVFDIDCPGARLLVVPNCEEDEDSHLLITGLDECGKEIYMPHKGDRYKGEYVRISKASPRYSQKLFTKITGISKSETKGYVRLYAYWPDTGDRKFLGEYRPSDTNPSYRRFRIVGMSCEKCFKVTILGRVRFCDNYADNDIIPISNLRALKLMAQQLQAEDNDDLQSAQYKNQRINQAIEDENSYKRTPRATIDFECETSPGSIKNLI